MGLFNIHIIIFQEKFTYTAIQGGINIRKVIFILFSLFIVGSIFVFTNQLNAKENTRPSDKEIVNILEKLKDKIGTYKISLNEIKIEVVGSQEYYDSVKDEVKEFVENTIKSTPFEKYVVKVTKSEISKLVSKEVIEEHHLMQEISTTIEDALSKFYPKQMDQINLENTPTELNIGIKTLLSRKQKKSTMGKEMEKKIFLELDKLHSNKLIKERNIQITIYNKSGEKIN